MLFRLFTVPMILVAFTAAPLFASKLKTWHVQGPTAYADARFENTVVTNQGTVRLAQLLKPIAAAKISAAQIWDMVEDKDGNLILATGGDGKLLKVTPAGDVTVLHEHKTGPILSLALAPDGSLYAGTGPDGQILHVSPKGEVKAFCDTQESYVWSLVYQSEAGALFAATGP